MKKYMFCLTFVFIICSYLYFINKEDYIDFERCGFCNKLELGLRIPEVYQSEILTREDIRKLKESIKRCIEAKRNCDNDFPLYNLSIDIEEHKIYIIFSREYHISSELEDNLSEIYWEYISDKWINSNNSMR